LIQFVPDARSTGVSMEIAPRSKWSATLVHVYSMNGSRRIAPKPVGFGARFESVLHLRVALVVLLARRAAHRAIRPDVPACNGASVISHPVGAHVALPSGVVVPSAL
jgi:hypothetical protein